jgi:muconate cycloisomerase
MPAVTEFQLFAVDLPFRAPFRHAAAERRTSESLFVRAQLDNGVVGWGESLPRVYVTGESRDEAFGLLRDAILPMLLGMDFPSLTDVIAFLGDCDGKSPPKWVHPDVPQTSAWASVDLALIDAYARSTGQLVHLVNCDDRDKRSQSAPCPYSGVVSGDRGWRYIASLAKMRAFHFPHVKLKLADEGAVSAATMARRVLGHRVDLRVDANMSWDVEHARDVIARLVPLGVRSFEQPIPANDVAGLAQLVHDTSAEIIADESFNDRDSLQTLIRERACTGVNVRISKCGGLIAAHARSREALEAGLTLQLGCQVGESSLLSAAHVILSSALSRTGRGLRYAEGCFGTHLLEADPGSPSVQFRFAGRPPRWRATSGLGVRIDHGLIERWSVHRARLA